MGDQTLRAIRVRTPTGRTDDLISVITRELSNHRRAIEVDCPSKIRVEVIFAHRSGNPVKVRYEALSETDLTNPKDGE
jgi:hypothetical protein